MKVYICKQFIDSHEFQIIRAFSIEEDAKKWVSENPDWRDYEEMEIE